MKYWNHLFFSALAITLLSACGGGGGGSAPAAPTYNGITTPAAVTSTNAQDLSAKTANATEEAIAQNTAKNANPFGIAIIPANSDINPLIVDITKQVASQLQTNINLPAGATITGAQLGAPFCGGSISYPDNLDPNNLNSTITYSNLCYDTGSLYGQIAINGTLIFTQTASEISIRYINFTVTGSGLPDTLSINMTLTCDTNFITCSISADFEGSDGKTYRVANLTITGTDTGPYSISATFYHPDYGYVTMSGNNLTYNCTNGNPGSGTINITGASGSSASITFTSCDGYSGTWNDGVSSGSFNGTWL